MRDLFEQWVEAWSERIRSPVLGSLAIAFVVSNWKPLFFLLFAEAPVWLRIRYFEHHTDINSLVWYPVVAGVIAALLIPWITLGGAWVARLPKFLLHRLQQDEGTGRENEKLRIEAERETARTEFEEERAKREAAEAKRAADREAEIIAAGRRLKEAEDVSEETKEDLEAERQLETQRGVDRLPEILVGDGIRQEMNRSILQVLGETDGTPSSEAIRDQIARKGLLGKYASINTQRMEVEADTSFKELSRQGLVEQTMYAGDNHYGLTASGYHYFDILEATSV